jgi:hypothetical protein
MFYRRSISLAALMLATAAFAATTASAKPIDQESSAPPVGQAAWQQALQARSVAMEKAYQDGKSEGLPAYPTPGDSRTTGSSYQGRDLVVSDDRFFRGADTTEQPKQPIPASHFRGADTTQQPKPAVVRYFRGADTTQQPPGSSPNIQIVRREVASDGWNWDDAAIGAATSAGLMILLVASAALVARRRTGPQVR